MTSEEFKELKHQDKVTLFDKRYRIAYFSEGFYIGTLKGTQGYIVNLKKENLPFLKKGWEIEKTINKKTPQEEIEILTDKLHRRNMQIQELKKYKTIALDLSALLGRLGYDLHGNKITR